MQMPVPVCCEMPERAFQRYKSLAGFAIFPKGAIFACGKRYALRSVRDLYPIASARSGDISHLSEAKIYRVAPCATYRILHKQNISRLRSKHIPPCVVKRLPRRGTLFCKKARKKLCIGRGYLCNCRDRPPGRSGARCGTS